MSCTKAMPLRNAPAQCLQSLSHQGCKVAFLQMIAGNPRVKIRKVNRVSIFRSCNRMQIFTNSVRNTWPSGPSSIASGPSSIASGPSSIASGLSPYVTCLLNALEPRSRETYRARAEQLFVICLHHSTVELAAHLR